MVALLLKKMKKRALILLLFTLTAVYAFGQAEASNWYFGENAGINFNIYTGNVTPINDGKLFTREGCASISNSNGELLFYTDGTTVYNASHEIMENGRNLFGDESSTQSAIVVPSPGDPNIYFIFTVGSNQTNTGLNYSVVDMFANDGKGIVRGKNLNLLPQCAEKISAVVKDCETRSIWVLTLSSESGFFGNQVSLNTFYAYEVGPNGVNDAPVKSSLPIDIYDVRGYLKLSPSGTTIACANSTSGLYLFDFDSQTGKVSSPEFLNIHDRNNKPYGLEFSPNSELLYVTSSNDYFNSDNPGTNENPLNHSSILIQYDLTAPDITQSQIILDSRNNYRGALQLGPNGKIYRSLSSTYEMGTNKLGVINQPNNSGMSADYLHDAIDLGTRSRATQGLPPFIASFFNEQIDIIKNGYDTNFLALCEGEHYTLVADEIIGGTYTWTRDDIILPENDFDLEISETGTYKVTITPPGEVQTTNCGFPQGEARVQVFEYPRAIEASLFQCDLDFSTTNITTFNLTEAYPIITDNLSNDNSIKFYKTENDAIAATNPILNTESYINTDTNETIYFRIENSFTGCFATNTLNLSISNTEVPTFQASPVCDEVDSPDGINPFILQNYKAEILDNLNFQEGQVEIKFYETEGDALLEINEINEYKNKSPYKQFIYYRVETPTNNECYGINTLELTVEKSPKILQKETKFYCLNNFPNPTKINAGLTEGDASNYTYLWNTGETTYEIDINEIGTYTVDITNQAGCSDQRTVIVEPSNIATINDIEVTDVSENNTINLITSGEGIYEFAVVNAQNEMIRPYQENNVFENVFPGLYTVLVKDVKNDCGIVPEPVSVIGFPKFFTPNNDGINDTWQIYGVSELFQSNTKIQIYNRYGKLLKELDPLGKGWDGSIRGKTLPNDDYWFSVQLQDGRVFKNHFTLKH